MSEPKDISPSKTADLRRNLRSPLLILKVNLDDSAKTFFGYAKNISKSGMFVATVSPREPGERYPVEIIVSQVQPQPLRCTCEVVWKRPFDPKSRYEPGMGVRFVDLPEEIAEKLDNWIKSQS